MAIVKALRRIASGGFGLIAATDQIACDAGAMTVTPTGGTQQSVPAAIAARLLADANGQVPITAVPFGLSVGNCLPYADCANALFSCATGFSNPTGGSLLLGTPNDPTAVEWAPKGMGCVYVRTINPVRSSAMQAQVIDINPQRPLADGTLSAFWPVIANQNYEFSAFVSCHRLRAAAYLVWCDANGSVIIPSSGTVTGYDGQSKGALSAYPRPFVIAKAPANAAYVIPLVRGLLDQTPTNAAFESYLFASGLQLAQAQPSQSTPSPWAPGATSVLHGAALAAGSIPSLAFFAPTRGQFFRALENSSAGRVATVANAVPSDRGSAINLAFEHTTFVTQAGPLAQFVKTTLSLTDAQLAAIIASARAVTE